MAENKKSSPNKFILNLKIISEIRKKDKFQRIERNIKT